jgi:hypothetical protein
MNTDRKKQLYELFKNEFPLEKYIPIIKRAINLHSNIEAGKDYSLIKYYILSWDNNKDRSNSIESFDSHKIKL